VNGERGPSVLFDARQSGPLTGVGRYRHELLRQLAQIEDLQLRPLCWRSQRREMRSLGLRPCLDVRGRAERSWTLPRVDVTHGPDFKPLRRAGASEVITAHDVAWHHLPDAYPEGARLELDSAVRRAAQSGTFAICDSESTLRDLVELYDYPVERTRRVYLGVDERYGSAQATDAAVTARFGLRAPFLLHVGAWVPRKNLLATLAAWRLLALEDDTVELVLVGGHADTWLSDRPRIEAWIGAHPELEPRVRILGHVPEADLPSLTRGAAALVSSSLWEGFGLTILQAMLAGVPVAAVANSSLPEIAGGFAYFSPSDEPDVFADAIRTALAMPAAARRMSVDHARRFTWERCARETLACYAAA